MLRDLLDAPVLWPHPRRARCRGSSYCRGIADSPLLMAWLKSRRVWWYPFDDAFAVGTDLGKVTTVRFTGLQWICWDRRQVCRSLVLSSNLR